MNAKATLWTHVVAVLAVLLSVAGVVCGADSPFVTPRVTEAPAERVDVRTEAEEFDGLRVFPDFHRHAGQGWYVKEYTHASGRAFAVCDVESAGATMVKRLDRVYPAGPYVVAARAVLTRWRKGFPTTYGQPSGSALKVELGMVRGNDFAPVAALPVRMLFGSGYGFVPAVTDEEVERRENQYGVETLKQTSRFGDPVVTAAGGWNALRVTAESIISGGIGDVPEFGLPFAAIDVIKVTNALRTPPAPNGAPDLARLDDWQKTQSPASVYVNWGLNGSYQRSQVRRGGENGRVDMTLDGYMPPDFVSLHYVRYDDQALYIGALIEDQPAYAGDADPRTWGESVVYSIVPDVEKHLADHAPAALRKVRVVQTASDRLSAILTMPDGSEKAVQGVCGGGGESRRYLVRVPFSMLGFSVSPGATCGFGISCADSDGADGKTRVEYDWSGASYALGDAFGFGQLLVR